MMVLNKKINHYSDFFEKNFTLISLDELNDKKNSYSQTENLFLYIDQYFYLIDINNPFACKRLPCVVVSTEDLLENIFKLQADNQPILIQNEHDIIGYLMPKTLLLILWTHYKETNAYFMTILETIDESCTVIDKEKNVVYWTKGAEHIFSFKKEDIIGKPITNFFDKNHLEVLNILKDGEPVIHQQHQAREDLVVLINSNPVMLENEIIGAVVSETDITSQIRMTQELYQTSEKLFELEQSIIKNDPFKYIRGNSPELNELKTRVKKAALTDTNILILGESGVGKELFAKAVHTLREDDSAPFIPINCGAITPSLFESEIFGYVGGAFSGADAKGKKGKAELAKNGTLFLDEIGEMPLDMQVKILRLLQEKKFFPVGGTEEIEVDFRVIAATNRDLTELVAEEKFREDLYYRLNVVNLDIPSLAERPSDIIELTHYFLNEISVKYDRPIHGISQDVMQALLNHPWPGNIRELKNVVERLVVFSEKGEIKITDLPFNPVSTRVNNVLKGYEEVSLKDQLQTVERDIIIRELNKVSGNKQQCAKNLNVTRATLYNRMHILDINI